jgi:hypothetical protein
VVSCRRVWSAQGALASATGQCEWAVVRRTCRGTITDVLYYELYSSEGVR